MPYDIRYTSFDGMAGAARLDDLKDLPVWLWERPGTHILDIAPVATSAERENVVRELREKAMAKFAEGLLDSLQNYRGA